MKETTQHDVDVYKMTHPVFTYKMIDDHLDSLHYGTIDKYWEIVYLEQAYEEIHKFLADASVSYNDVFCNIIKYLLIRRLNELKPKQTKLTDYGFDVPI